MSHKALVDSLSSLNPKPFELSVFDRIVFSGAFEDRWGLESLAAEKGLIVRSGVSGRTNILVIGNSPNDAWKHGSFGLKIEKAINLVNSGLDITIVSESKFVKALLKLPNAHADQLEECERLQVIKPDFEVREGTSIALTGGFNVMPRKKLEAILYDKYKFVCTKGVSGATKFLVIGDKKQIQGSKLKTALEKGVDCLSEDEFFQQYPV